MQNFETVVVLRPDISTTQVDAVMDRMLGALVETQNEDGSTAEITPEELIDRLGSVISRREYWGLRTLAHRMRKHRRGHYVLVNFAASSAAKNEMIRRMSLSSDILRQMTTATAEVMSEPSVMMQRERMGDSPPMGSRDTRDTTGRERRPPNTEERNAEERT